MQAYDMVNTSGFFAIGDGGRVKPFNDRGRTHEVIWKEQPEKAYKRKEREMIERNRPLPSARESVLERELWNQVSSNKLSVFPTAVNPRLAADYAAYKSRLNREDLISRQLFDQINVR